MDPPTSQASSLIAALMRADDYPYPNNHRQLIETHISWVILTGRFAFKIKKPLDLGFVDFTSLEKRRFYCEEEVRLNRRLAPDLYLGVVAITGTPENPSWSEQGHAIEYAVKMVQFPPQDGLDQLLERDELKPFHIDRFARLVASFHQNIDSARSDEKYGGYEHVYQPVKENFLQLGKQISDNQMLQKLKKLEDWSNANVAHLRSIIEQRKNDGYIRECHGDLHLRNMAWFSDKPLLFDCIEFNPNLYWIDVISEIAFLLMDLQKNNKPKFAQRFLNRYLERTGDYAGVRLLPFYLSYRALVRAKVEAIKAHQFEIKTEDKVTVQQATVKQAKIKQTIREYLQLAQDYTHLPEQRLIITHGFSASGKTTLTQLLLEQLSAIRIRSDVERKRLLGLQAKDSRPTSIDQGLYSAKASKKTYGKLVQLAEMILESGYSVIVDAACLKIEQRKCFQELAVATKIPWLILDITAPKNILKQRIVQRKKDASDAGPAVLEHQLKTAQMLSPIEIAHTLRVDTENSIDIEKLAKQIKSVSFM